MTRSPYSTSNFFTMPLAFDFTSTLVIGSTLPVATTLLAKSFFSTLASFEGSIFELPWAIAIPAQMMRARTTAPILERMMMIFLRRFLRPFTLPFTTSS